MKIVVLRHGKPNINTSEKVSPIGFGKWVSDYDKAGILDSNIPDRGVIDKAGECEFTVCSDLPRSIESARLLGISSPELISSEFRECEMPYGSLTYPKLSTSTWSLIFRLFQMAGFSFNAESYKEAIERSKKCANHLADLARNHGSVLFVGHGALNWLLHKQLISTGWLGPKKSAKNHWAFSEYVCKKT